MDVEAFKSAYNAGRNGANEYFRHPLVPSFLYTDGVKDCAEAGCYWLLDILATELKVPVGEMAVVTVRVKGSTANIRAELYDDQNPPALSKQVPFTDMPEGVWFFYINNDGQRRICILPSEY